MVGSFHPPATIRCLYTFWFTFNSYGDMYMYTVPSACYSYSTAVLQLYLNCGTTVVELLYNCSTTIFKL